ncbi:cupin domain-containing protein [Olivibacter sp. SDN3]|nr:cupin domain-containing protein [Olivibacter sp. SDN3]
MAKVQPKMFHFEDDGSIPNNDLPLLLYGSAFAMRGNKGADWLEEKFMSNDWGNAWRWGVYPFHHYHSNTHEVLGVFSGNALLHLGGERGEKVQTNAGDLLIIPAGVGHKCLAHSDDFAVVGAYPKGLSPDLNKGEEDERPQADKNIEAVQLPATDPLFGKDQGLREIWIKVNKVL